jgi:hypothetical protein
MTKKTERSRAVTCVLNLLFNKRIFLAFLLLMCLAVFGNWTFRRDVRPAAKIPEAVEYDPKTLLADIGTDKSRPYQHGYRVGFDAFLKQTGRYMPRPAVASYTSSENFDMEDSEVERGYVDGYHKATELQNCPRSGYEH